jgi:ABC-2 type transport system ATP-binding protein
MRAIQTFQLSKRYGATLALDHVSLTVDEGQVFGLLGPNGAGKTTLVKILTGLAHPTDGTARLLGCPYDAPDVRRRIGSLPEVFRYPPWLTALETLRFHHDLLGVRWRPSHALDLLDRVGLADAGGRRIHTYSKGMQQRLGLAVALVGDPALLFLDEPTSALDPLGRHDVTALLRDLRQGGMTILLNTHLLADLEGLADTVALIQQGVVRAEGPVPEMLKGAESRWRIATGPLTAAQQAALAEWGAKVTARPEGAVLTVVLERSRLPAFQRALHSAGVDVYEVETLSPSLEDWFLDTLRSGGR